MVVRQADHARPKLDGAGALGRGGQVHLGRRDDLPAGAVVLADPRLVESELVEPLDQLHVALEGVRRVAADLMERSHENPKLQPPRQNHGARVALPRRAGAEKSVTLRFEKRLFCPSIRSAAVLMRCPIHPCQYPSSMS